jgi:hypothetical protein
MQPDRVDLGHLALAGAEDLKRLTLEVAILHDDHEVVENWITLISSFTSWHALPLEGLEHAAYYLKRTLPHILIAHWHYGGDYRHTNPLTNLVLRFKRRRQKSRIGVGPLLVGTYWDDSEYYRDPTFMPFIERTYDCSIDLADMFGLSLIEMLTLQLWAHLTTQGTPSSNPDSGRAPEEGMVR